VKYNYVHLAIDGVFNRKHSGVTLIDEAQSHIFDDSEDCFSTYVIYSQDALEYCNKTNGSISGYDGIVDTSIFPIDVDGDNALDVTRQIIHKLKCEFDVDENYMIPFYSGKKGFHLYIPSNLFGISPTPQSELVRRYKWIAKEIHEDIDFNIYKKNNLLRIENTIHSKSGIRKIPLTIKEIMNCDMYDIRELAKYPRHIDYPYFHEGLINDNLEAMWLVSNREINNISNAVNGIPKDQQENAPTATTHTVSSISKKANGVPKGQRNNKCFELSVDLKAMGIKLEDGKDHIIAWNQTNSPPEENLYQLMRTVESAYSYSNLVIDSWELVSWHLKKDKLYNSMNHEKKVMYAYLLARFNTKVNDDWNGITINKYETIISRYEMAKQCDTTEQKVKTFIEKLIKEKRIVKEIVEINTSGWNGWKTRTLLRWIY